jgi:ATP-dependent helicase/nuclease subunit A
VSTTTESIAPEKVAREIAAAQRRAADPDVNVWVSASAGAGKTKVLVDRVLRLLLAGSAPEKLLCLTFTRAAAAEMANRVNAELGQWAAAGDDALIARLAELTGTAPDLDTSVRARRLFARVLDAPGGLKIMTIHAFCESVLGRFPLEARVTPHFEVMDERTSLEALLAARNHVFERAQSEGRGPLAAALAHVSGWLGEDGFSELMASFVEWRARLARLQRDPRFAGNEAAVVAALLGISLGLTLPDLYQSAASLDPGEERRLFAAARALIDGTDAEAKRGNAIADWLSSPDARAEGFEDYAGKYLTWDTKARLWKVRASLVTKATAKAHPDALGALDTEAERVRAVMERRNAILVAESTTAALMLARELLSTYEAHKVRHALLDYDDLILAVRDLLEGTLAAPERGGGAGAAAWVLYKLDGGIDHVLIDEAQDTNPDQWAVVRALADEFFADIGTRNRRRTVFAVGDAKQSIFSFQRASPEEFRKTSRHFAERARDAGERWDAVGLDASFRSADAVLRAVDATFADPAARAGVAEDDIRHVLTRSGDAGLVEVWPLAPVAEGEESNPWRPPGALAWTERAESRLAWGIATRIRDWCDRKERLESQNRPIRPGDIMVLVRRRTGFVEALVSALKSFEIPVTGVDRMVLTDQLAIMDLVALGSFLCLPNDDLTLATVLKGPLIGLDEDELFELAHGRTGTLWEALRRKQTEPAFAEAADYLAGTLARVDLLPPFELYSDLLGRHGGRERIVARLGIEANDPIDEFLARAFEYERLHPSSLQGFLQWLAEAGTEIKRDLEQGVRDEVRILTVHGSKGLQSPIVLLADTTQVPTQSPRVLWTPDADGRALPLWAPRRDCEEAVTRAARDEADLHRDEEHRRLLYVAMTRAADRLYVCGWAMNREAPEACWYNLVRRGLETIAEPVDFDIPAIASTGWSGPGLRLTTPQTKATGEAKPAEPPALPPLPRWAREPPPAEPTPWRPLLPSRPSEPDPPSLSPLARDGQAFPRGVLVHRLLELLPAVAPTARAKAARRFLARPIHAISAAEQADIAAEVLAVLDAPDAREIFGPASRSEVPVVGMVGGVAVSGRIDRLAVAGGRVVIVDYKTNRPIPEPPDRVPASYLRQLALYRALVARIYEKLTITCGILWTAGPRLMWISAELLDGAILDGTPPQT